MEGKQELGAADDMAFTVRKQRELNAGALFISPFSLVQDT